ncbi:unnamed protein product [Allacma fusca]|uniref:C2H2-type domain-containing protein n=1 Tax=Allacma fusca TaxID=39272 RepID=A0A8J2M0V9_9HEXA|nr:unnamed protein product [Allacma fusca]
MRDQERSHLQHLVSSSVPSPPYGGLTLLSPSAIFGADPSAMFSAHLLATIAASNPNARFQLPIPISLGVPAPTTPMYHPPTTGPVTGLPTSALANAQQLDILSSWMREHSSAKEDRKISTTKTGNKKQRDSNWSVSKVNKKNKSSAQHGLVSSENCINNRKLELNGNESDIDIKHTIIPTDKTSSKGGHKKDKIGDVVGPQTNNGLNNNNNNNHNMGSIQQQSNQQFRDKIFTCNICSRCFGYKHVLQNHERTHTGEKPFECTICHKKFTRDHHLKTHMRLHTGEKPYQCTHCDRQFVQVANLRRHLRVHTGERPYACDLCVSRFSDSNQLKAHTLIHKGEKPYSCEECGGRFRRRHHLVHHKCNSNKDCKTSPQSFPQSPPEISPTSNLKRERKPRETRRIVRLPGLPVATVTSSPIHEGYIPVGPEQTHPEDLSVGGNGLRNRHFSGSHSSCSASPSPPSGGSHGSLGPYCRSITSSEPPEYSSDDERSVAAADSSNVGKMIQSDKQMSHL